MNGDRFHLLSFRQDSIPIRAIPANVPPAMKVAAGAEGGPQRAGQNARHEQSCAGYQIKHPERRAPEIGGGGINDQRGQQPLCRPHVQTPKDNADSDLPGCAGGRQDDVRRDQESHPERQQQPPADDIREPAKRVCARRVDDVHDDEHARDQRYRQPDMRGGEQQERLAESPKGEDRGDPDQPPVCAVQASQLGSLDRERTPLCRARHVRLLHPIQDQQDRDDCGKHGDPKHKPEVVVARCHEQHGEQGADKRSYRIHRLTQAESGAAQFNRSDIADQGVPRRTPNALPDPINKASGHHDADTGGKRKQRLCQRGKSVADQNKRLPFPDPIADGTREQLADLRCRLGNSLR